MIMSDNEIMILQNSLSNVVFKLQRKLKINLIFFHFVIFIFKLKKQIIYQIVLIMIIQYYLYILILNQQQFVSSLPQKQKHSINMNIPDRFINNSQTNKIQKYKQVNNIQFINVSKQDSLKQIPSYLQEGSDIDLSPYKNHQKGFTYQNNFCILLQGFLQKKTLNSNYQSRYFVLNSKRLLYFTNQSKTQLKGCFNLVSLVQHNLEVLFKFPQILFKVNPKESQQVFKDRFILQLQNQDKSTFSLWKEQIQNVLKNIRSQIYFGNNQLQKYFPKIQISKLMQMNQKISNQYNSNFWNNIDISLQELIKYSSHLDILLFRSKSPIAYLSRLFMRSYYDHVAIIIKSELNQTYIFQAIQSRGVCLLDLQTFLEINKQIYEEIGYRKLIFNDNCNEVVQNKLNLQQLQEYLNSLLGKKYELSLNKLLGENTEVNSFIKTPRQIENFNHFSNKENINHEKEEAQIKPKVEKTFFCSQLIADIYLKFGLLTAGKGKDYWPKDFQQNQMPLKQNCKFTPIMKVCFQQTQN